MKLFNEKGEAIACPLCCCIRLVNGEEAYVDPEDWVALDRTSWRRSVKHHNLRVRKLCGSGKTRITVFLHRIVAKTPLDQVCHHLNENPLDNRRLNLANMSHYEHKILHSNAGQKWLLPERDREILRYEAALFHPKKAKIQGTQTIRSKRERGGEKKQ